MGQNKAQSSLEYLLVVALTFAIIVPTAYLLYSYSKESTREIKDSQIAQIGKTIVDAAEVIFYAFSREQLEFLQSCKLEKLSIRGVGWML